MKAKVKIEHIDRKSGRLISCFEQPSRSFTEGLMHCLYSMIAREISDVIPRLGYTVPRNTGGQEAVSRSYFGATERGKGEATLRVGGSRSQSRDYLAADRSVDGDDIYYYGPKPVGIWFGEGDTAVDSRDNSLEFPLGAGCPLPVAVVQTDTVLPADTSWFWNGVDTYYAICDALNPNRFYTFNTAGTLTSTVITDSAITNQMYLWLFVDGGFLYAYRANKILYKINIVTGATVLSRNASADTAGNCYGGFYDAVAGNIVGISTIGEIIRWNLADFTVHTAAVFMGGVNDMQGGTYKIPQWASPIDAANNYLVFRIDGSAGTDRDGFILYDVVNNIMSPVISHICPASATDDERSGAQYSNGWVYHYHYWAAGWMVLRTRWDLRNLSYSSTRVSDPDTNAVDGEFDISCEMVNNSGGNVTVKEIGIHAHSGALSFPLISRDVLGVPVVLADGEILRGTYTISASI